MALRASFERAQRQMPRLRSSIATRALSTEGYGPDIVAAIVSSMALADLNVRPSFGDVPHVKAYQSVSPQRL
jgi:hypothetical protein